MLYALEQQLTPSNIRRGADLTHMCLIIFFTFKTVWVLLILFMNSLQSFPVRCTLGLISLELKSGESIDMKLSVLPVSVGPTWLIIYAGQPNRKDLFN